jgi:hypothetical protein
MKMKGGLDSMRNKKSQQEIIVTVLLVLIAIAAVVVIASFIMNQVRKGTETGAGKMDCIKLDFQVTRAINAATTVTIKRNDDGAVNISRIAVNVAGKTWNGAANIPTALSTVDVTNTTTPLVTGQQVTVDALLLNGASCPNIASGTVTAV